MTEAEMRVIHWAAENEPATPRDRALTILLMAVSVAEQGGRAEVARELGKILEREVWRRNRGR